LGASAAVPNFDDLLFLAASLSATPSKAIESAARPRRCSAHVCHAPDRTRDPITVAGMSFGALSARVKEALGRAATKSVHRPHRDGA